MFDDVGASNVAITVLLEGAVSHHRILDSIVLIVDGNNHREVIFYVLSELKSRHVVEVEKDCTFRHFLTQPGSHCGIVDVVFSVGSVEHFWGIVRVLLLCYAHVDSDVGVAKGIVFESDLKLVTIDNSLRKSKTVMRRGSSGSGGNLQL